MYIYIDLDRLLNQICALYDQMGRRTQFPGLESQCGSLSAFAMVSSAMAAQMEYESVAVGA